MAWADSQGRPAWARALQLSGEYGDGKWATCKGWGNTRNSAPGLQPVLISAQSHERHLVLLPKPWSGLFLLTCLSETTVLLVGVTSRLSHGNFSSLVCFLKLKKYELSWYELRHPIHRPPKLEYHKRENVARGDLSHIGLKTTTYQQGLGLTFSFPEALMTYGWESW